MSTEITVYNSADTSVNPPEAAQVVIVTEAATAVVAGVPNGGTTGQQLIKSSNSDFDTEWHTSDADPTIPPRVSVLEYDMAETRDTLDTISQGITDGLVVDMAGSDYVIPASDSTRQLYVVLNAADEGTLTLTNNASMPAAFVVVNASSNKIIIAFSGGEASSDPYIMPNSSAVVSLIDAVGFTLLTSSRTDNVAYQNYKQVLSSHGGWNIQQGAENYTDNALVAPLSRISQSEYDIADMQGQIAYAEGMLVDHAARIGTAEGDIDSLEGRVAHAEYSIDELRDSVSESSGYGMLFEYNAKTSSTSGDPSNGKILWDNATQTSASSVNISHLTSNGVDIDPFIDNLKSGDILHLQSKADHSHFQKWTVNGTHTHYTGYCSITVTLESSGGGDFANNSDLLVGTVYKVSQLEQDVAALESRAAVTEYDIAEMRDSLDAINVDQLKSVDMTSGNVTINAADSAAYNTVIVSNTGDGTEAIRVLTFTAGASNPAQLTIINTGAQPIRVTSGETLEQVVFKRAVLVYQNGTGFRYADDESVVAAAAPFGVQKPASAGEQLIGTIQIPRGSLKSNGDTLEVDYSVVKGGTAGTEFVYFEIGTTRGTGTTSIVTLQSLATTTDNMHGRLVIFRTSATTIKIGGLTGWHVPYGTSLNESTDITVSSLDSNDLYLNMTAATNTAGGTEATVDCRRILARIMRA